jgi:hypothetical protein
LPLTGLFCRNGAIGHDPTIATLALRRLNGAGQGACGQNRLTSAI